MEVAGSLGIDGIYNSNLAKQNILNNLKPTPKVNPPLGDEKEINSPFEVIYMGYQLNVDIKGKVSIGKLENSVVKEPIPDTSFVGCYADFEDSEGNPEPDGIIDGIIFVDLAVIDNIKESKWNIDEGIYKISPVEDKSKLKKYYIKDEQVVDKRWSEDAKKVISPISNSGEKDRFYVMALEDIDTNLHTWYNLALGKMSDFNNYTSKEFGKGKENTKKMIARSMVANGSIPKGYENVGKIPYGAADTNDLWKMEKVKSKFNNGWFVPSRAEWLAFGNELKISEKESNIEYYKKHNLKNCYWSSSQYDASSVYYVGFNDGLLNSSTVDNGVNIRLMSTF